MRILAGMLTVFVMGCQEDSQSATQTPAKIHVYTSSVPTAVPASSSLVVKSVTFTPTGSGDVVLQVHAEGTCTRSSGEITLMARVLDAAGYTVFDSLGGVTIASGGSGIPFSIDPGRDGAGSGTAASFPSTSYSIQLRAITNSSWSGQIDSIRLKVVTLETPGVVDPSGSFSQ